MSQPLVRAYSQRSLGQAWMRRYQGQQPYFACVLGFTATGLIPGISAAGATPTDRQYTAIADAEFLYHGPQPQPHYPLPPLEVVLSPTFITRAVVAAQGIPMALFNAGLPLPPPVPVVDLGGEPARCLTSGAALPGRTVDHLLSQGLFWGKELATHARPGYLILGECVVGGTATALALLTGLGMDAQGKVNSSHPRCNHGQKAALVNQGLQSLTCLQGMPIHHLSPLDLVAGLGDPTQVALAGMAIAASQIGGVMLAGGTQMLAVYALIQAIAHTQHLDWNPEQVVVGTTRWVAEDPFGDTVGLARLVGKVPLLATQLSFATSRYPALQRYEAGYVKEGVGAGGCGIAAHLYQNWDHGQLLDAIEALVGVYQDQGP